MNFDKELDARGLNCPLPILRAKKALSREMEELISFAASERHLQLRMRWAERS